MQRVWFSLEYCDQKFLDSLDTGKKCKSRNESFEWLKKVDFNVHYKQPQINMNNLKNLSNILETKENIIRY